jgi:hypothetical protein
MSTDDAKSMPVALLWRILDAQAIGVALYQEASWM